MKRLPFAARLIAWQKMHGRQGLPWQGTRDPYRVWLAEVMLQQTQVATVVPYYERFLARFPDVGALAAAPLDHVVQLWSGLGYYRRAQHLHAAARSVVERHGGAFPRDLAALAQLPGVGRSTAGAIAALSYALPAAILDGNVKRVLARHRGVEGYPGTGPVERRLWQIAASLLPPTGVEAYTQGLMDLGATVCTRALPRCAACPVAGDCVARRDGRAGELPTPRPARVLPQRALRVLLVRCAGSLLLERRPPRGVWGGLWSLPEMALDEDVAAHCHARFATEVSVGAALPPIEHALTHLRLRLHPQRVDVRRWDPRLEGAGRAWLPPDDALAAALPAPVRNLLRQERR